MTHWSMNELMNTFEYTSGVSLEIKDSCNSYTNACVLVHCVFDYLYLYLNTL